VLLSHFTFFLTRTSGDNAKDLAGSIRAPNPTHVIHSFLTKAFHLRELSFFLSNNPKVIQPSCKSLPSSICTSAKSLLPTIIKAIDFRRVYDHPLFPSRFRYSANMSEEAPTQPPVSPSAPAASEPAITEATAEPKVEEPKITNGAIVNGTGERVATDAPAPVEGILSFSICQSPLHFVCPC
jgi:hypothetical protein